MDGRGLEEQYINSRNIGKNVKRKRKQSKERQANG